MRLTNRMVGPVTAAYDCLGCGAGMWLTEEEARDGCIVSHPSKCKGPIVLRVERSCRLDEGECARRCTGKPGGCDTFGEGLESDGGGCRVVGRAFIDGQVVLDLRPENEAGR